MRLQEKDEAKNKIKAFMSMVDSMCAEALDLKLGVDLDVRLSKSVNNHTGLVSLIHTEIDEEVHTRV